MPRLHYSILFVALASCSGSDDANTTLTVAWKFASGDCTSNKIDKVRVTLTPPGGTASTKELACSAGSAELGTLTKGSYGISGEALDAAGKVRFTSTQTATFPDGKISGPLDMTFRPKASNVTVTWNGCPPSVILPYTITIYRPPTSGTTLTNKVKDTQESCQTKKATLESIAAGEYVVEVDSRAVTPAVKGTQKVTVIAGDDVEVHIPVP